MILAREFITHGIKNKKQFNMNFEDQNIERTRQDSLLTELSKDTTMLEDSELNSSLASIETKKNGNGTEFHDDEQKVMVSMINPGAVAYGLNKLADMPIVKETVENCKNSIGETLSNLGGKIEKYINGLEDVSDFFTGNDHDAKSLENLGASFTESRDFGLDRCTVAAETIFNPGVIENWSNLSLEQRKEIAGAYAREVADAFQLQNYTGVYFEDMEPGTYGYNNGDGSVHISNEIISAWTSPLQIVDTITHELRHQYQSEAIQGYHNVSADVVNEWAAAQAVYTYDQPYCYDPWGYMYNPLEIDARYAGETVVRNLTHDIINS